jgi:hypothetical protein
MAESAVNKTAVAQQAKTASFLPPARGLLQRQCACGNHTVAGGECATCAKKKSGLQRKLAIGASNDPLEREADRVADQVMASPTYSAVSGVSPRIQRYTAQASGQMDAAPASVDRVLASPGRPLDTTLQQDIGQRFGHDFSRVRVHSEATAEQPISGPTGEVRPIVSEVLRSPGHPLDTATRDFMEPRFGHDFSRVRMHTDARAAESARAVGALAYTVGQDVVFGAKEYAPASQHGRGLLAHELAHTIQQRNAAGGPPSADPHGIFESSAAAAGRDVANGGSISRVLPACGVGLSRAPASPDAFNDQMLAEELKRATANLKPGEKPDWWLASLRYEADKRAKARQPVKPATSKPPAEPKAPPPDPVAERAAAEADANAYLAASKARKHADDDDEDTPAPKKKSQQRKTVPQRPTTLSLNPEGEAQQVTSEQWMQQYNKKNDAESTRIDEQISEERELLKIPYKERLRRAREACGYFQKDFRKLTGEEVWTAGLGHFLEREKKWVYEDQNSMQELAQEEAKEELKQLAHNLDTKRYNEEVARGEQLSSPAPFIQPFAFAALSPLVGAAYAGTQTGEMGGEAYNACAHGTKAECAAAIAQGGVAVVVHRATRGNPQTEPPFPSPARTAKPDLVITRPPKLDPQTGRIKASLIETASGRHFDAEVHPQTGIGQIVDRKSRQVVGIIRNGEVSRPAADILPPAKVPAPLVPRQVLHGEMPPAQKQPPAESPPPPLKQLLPGPTSPVQKQLSPGTVPQIAMGDVKSIYSYNKGIRHISEMEGRGKYNTNGNIGIALYDRKTGDVHLQVLGRPAGPGQPRKIIYEGPIGRVQIPAGRTPIQIGNEVEEPVRDLVRRVTGQPFPAKRSNAPGPDLTTP